jgi:hypothetical protein
MLSAKRMSDIIRMKRRAAEEPNESEVDVGKYRVVPDVNPQDIINMDMYGQVEDTINSPEKIDARDAVNPPGEDSQSLADLKKKMMKIKAMFDKL